MASTDEPRAPEDEDTRKRITNAAFRLFVKNGYAGTSTLAIATKAKVSKRDLYAMFSSKQDALIACISARSARMRLPSGWPAPASKKTLQTTLVKLANTLLAEICNPDVVAMFRVAISEADRSPEVAQILERSRYANLRTVADLLADAQALDLLAAGSTEAMAREFRSALVGELLLSRLLGVSPRPTQLEIERHAAEVTKKFLACYQK